MDITTPVIPILMLILFARVELAFGDESTKANLTEFTKLLYNMNEQQVDKLNWPYGIETDRCASNQLEHNAADKKICPGLYNCLPFKGHFLIKCTTPGGLYKKDTYPVFDNETREFNSKTCPSETYQPDYYRTNDYGIHCRAATPPKPSAVSPSNKGLSWGEIVGIVVGIVVLVLGPFAVFGIRRCILKGRQKQYAKEANKNKETNIELRVNRDEDEAHQYIHRDGQRSSIDNLTPYSVQETQQVLPESRQPEGIELSDMTGMDLPPMNRGGTVPLNISTC